ncbi:MULTISPECIES: PDR/VanB family oxidoreductase [Pseudomonas]|uniref:Oxidoreductase n=1 Tax=Pseudomonas hunanensis TaxID=1247546 RepID=A0ABD6MVZ9_9PSED|nr:MULTISPECIES: PDR/VanB family oxidoreductase [Pseudomonas]MDH4846247.1 oxidoreductase [Pseudomonas sp. BN605]MDH4858536.1 oxidoreductase [Pseudomonas sp. BN505]NWL07984.1 oxidoreductase [Pseudomonas hunanensis]NWL45136.1 oxidoreductase [Pseudomonas hunanensis]
MNEKLTLKVTDISCEAKDVMVLELKHPEGKDLPAFTAGAHIEIYLQGNLIRHYSLCNDPAERGRYCIGVGLAKESRGGSRSIHQTVRVGMTIQCSPPRNNFPMASDAAEHVFVAGGIGVTPIMAMIKTCIREGKKWRLFYCARNRQRTAFYEELKALAPNNCTFHFDDEEPGFFQPTQALIDIDPQAHIYCCGPQPLMKAVEAAECRRAPSHVHFEWFTATAVDTTKDKPFKVIMLSGAEFEVPPGKSILDVLEERDEGVPYSCREGLCATCRTGVIKGVPDHRDSVLSKAERESNSCMMICVSRALSDTLELEL